MPIDFQLYRKSRGIYRGYNSKEIIKQHRRKYLVIQAIKLSVRII